MHKGLNNDTIKNYDDLPNKLDDNLFKKICYHSAEYICSEKDTTSHYGLNLKNYVHSTSPLRRFNDYIIQQIYTNNTLYDIDEICDIMNKANSNIKQVYYDIVKLDLIQELHKTNTDRIFNGIVTKILETGIIVYIEQLDIIHPIYFTSKLSDILEITTTNSTITITHKRNKQNVTLELLQTIELNTIITPYEHKINHKIRFHIEKPSVIGLLDM